MIYLGVNGDAFLAFASSLLQRGVSGRSGLGSGDLPVDGDANQMMGSTTSKTATLELPVEGTRVVSTVVAEDVSRKPVWWYLMGFPLWCGIAASGRNTMRKKFAEEDAGAGVTTALTGGGGYNNEENDHYQSHSTPPISPPNAMGHNAVANADQSGGDGDLMVPNRGDYCMAVFFIIFGAVAIVAGLTSNIVIIIKGDGAEEEDVTDDGGNQYGYGN